MKESPNASNAMLHTGVLYNHELDAAKKNVIYSILEEYIPRKLIDQALAEYRMNDAAHLEDHAFNVVLHADIIIKRFPELQEYRGVILIAALLHDVKCHINRDKHHILGALAVYREYMNTHMFTRCNYFPTEITMIEEAVLEHRASWKYKRSHNVSEAVAAADRGKPELLAYLRRAVRYRYAQLPEGVSLTDQIKARIVRESLEHMRDKFGVNGYAWETMPKYTLLMYEEDINEMKSAVQYQEGETFDKGMALFDTWVS